MTIDSSTRIVFTGAPGGLGSAIIERVASLKCRLLLVSSPGVSLEDVCHRATALGAEAHGLVADLRTEEGIAATVAETWRTLGGIDLLVNNAGIEHTCLYHELGDRRMMDVMEVNLLAPMRLTQRFLPAMVQQGHGRIVSMASLAGRAPPACQEPYAASKAGLVAFTMSLRASYRGTGISANVICPGFVEAGIYRKLREQTGITAPAIPGTSSTDAVVNAFLRILKTDAPEVIVNRVPMRPLLMLQQAFPRVFEAVVHATGSHAFFQRISAKLKEGAAA